MKSLLVVLLVVVVAEAKQVCIPGSTFKQSCNTCFCTSDGLSAACTLMGCPEDNLYMIYPTIESTTEQPKEDKKSYSTRKPEAEQVCIPNTTFMRSCNSCFCNSEGTDAVCTLKGCPEDDLWQIDPAIKLETENPSNEDGALKLAKRSYSTSQSVHGRHCQPGTTVKHYCNTCMCTTDGQVGRCTRMFCDEEMYNEDGTYRISPNSIFNN